MTIAIGCDEAAFEFKEVIKAYLIAQGQQVEDYGVYDTTPVLYPDVALKVAEAVAAGNHERGILICGTGIGMSIVANKVPGIRAALCHDVYSARKSRTSNNAQIITMGARVIATELAKTILDAWLEVDFQGGGSTPKVQRINEIDALYHRAPGGE